MEIIQAATQLISERSIQELTIKNLSARIGVTEAALYRHFRSKVDILVAILEQFREHGEVVRREALQRNAGPMELLEFIFLTHVRTFVEKPYLADVVFSEEIFQNEDRLADMVRSMMQQNFDAFVGMMRQGQQAGSIRNDIAAVELTTIFVGALRMLITRWRLQRFTDNLEHDGVSMWKALQRILST
ncbi:MAG: TetR/AcrR family transcriptional regulator [Bacteroidetes bacterium]|nr:TetR/AcrR family transcriptional regulator [Bacteroidota bacterium]